MFRSLHDGFGLISVQSVSTKFFAATLLVTAGCNSGPSPQELTAYLTEVHRETKTPMSVEKVEITKSEKSGDPPEFRIEFTAKDKINEDLFVSVTLDEACSDYKYDAAPFQAAIKKLGQLRVPERDQTAEKLPKDRQFKGIYRKIRSENDEFDYTGSVVAVRDGKNWKFAEKKIKLPDELLKLDVSLVKRAQLKTDAIILDGANANKAVSDLIAQQKLFVDAVDAAAKEMNNRLVRERTQLLAGSEVGQSWTVFVPTGKGPPTKARATFIQRTEDGKSVIALLTNVEQPVERSVWSGSLELTPLPDEKLAGRSAPRAKPDGWAIRLVPVTSGAVFPLADARREITIAATADGRLFLANLAQPQTFTVDDKAPKLPACETLIATLKEGTAPGQTWEGTLQYPGQASSNVRMTFMEQRDKGQYVRAVIEPSEDPSAAVVCTGTIGDSISDVYGWPIQLKYDANQQKNAVPFRGGTLTLGFSLDGTESLQGDGLILRRVAPVKEFLAGRKRWTAALQPGAKWSGTIIHTLREFAGKTDKFTFTVAEVRDDLAYVRVTAEGSTDPLQFRVFEGVVATKESEVDGFGLVVRGKTNTRNYSAGFEALDWDSAFFGIYLGYGENAPHSFRLMPDGKSIVGLSKKNERIKLTREETNAPLPLDRANFVQTWQEKCAVGSRWRGLLKTRSGGQKVDVDVEFVKASDEPDAVAISISIAKQPKSKMAFTGQFQPDDDINVNGYAIKLKKQTAGTGDSFVFGKTTGWTLEFRLSHDGQQLMGTAGGTGIGAGGSYLWPEILELTRVEGTQKVAPPPRNGGAKDNESDTKK